MKRFLSMVLALVLCCALFPAAQAQSEYLYGEVSLADATYAEKCNIQLVCDALNGWVIPSGGYFSFNQAVGPRTREMGYRRAINGRGAYVTGGGVAQAAAALYQAMKYSNSCSINEMTVYGKKYVGTYVTDGEDAVVTDYSAGIDFSFWNMLDTDMVISLWIDEEYDVLGCTLTSDDNVNGTYSLIGYATTPLYGTSNKISNIKQCADAISGVTLYSYDVFSFNELVGPRTEAYGYRKALNGRGVNVIGGGVAQVASTVYLAIKNLDCVDILSKSTYGKNFTDGYVSDNRDAIVTDYNAGTDFSFCYNGYAALMVEVYIQDDELVCCVYEKNS